jgi:hypothetical protein
MEIIIYALIASNTLSVIFLAIVAFKLIGKEESKEKSEKSYDSGTCDCSPSTTISPEFPAFTSSTETYQPQKNGRGRPRKGTVRELNSI